MSEAVSLRGQTVARSRYIHLRSLLGVAVVAIVGLTIAVVVLAANQGSTTRVVAPVAAMRSLAIQAPTNHPHGRPGAALDASQSATAQIGATLNHRGLDASQTSAAQAGARLDHRGNS